MAEDNSRGLATATFPLLRIIALISFTNIVKGDEAFCQAVCDRTSQPQVCMDVLGNNVHGMSKLRDIQIHFLNHGVEKTEELAGEYHSIQDTSSNDFGYSREHLSAFRVCERAYKDSVHQYVAAFKAYNERKYRKVKEKFQKVVTNGGKCNIKSVFEDETTHEENVATINLQLIDFNGHP